MSEKRLTKQTLPEDGSVYSEELSTTPTEHTAGGSTLASFERKDRAVQAGKLLLVVVIMIFATACGAMTHYLITLEERTDFQRKFQDYAIEISELVHMEARDTFMTAENFANTITSYATATNAIWPYVTLPHFEARGVEANVESYALMTAFSPIVFGGSKSPKSYWEKYSTKNQAWIQEGVEYNHEVHRDFIKRGTFKADRITPKIFRYEWGQVVEENASAGPYLPAWQMAPAPHDNTIINYNLLSNPIFELVYTGLLNTGKPVLSEITDLHFLYGGSIHDDVTHPHSFLFQPVYKNFEKKHDVEHDVVGLVISILTWDNFFKKLLPENVKGITIVLQDTCNDTYTYEINGRAADFLGPGDLHEKEYDDMVFATDFAPSYTVDSTTTGEHCEFFLHIYPTKKFEKAVTDTGKAAFYTSIIMLLFFGTSVAFLLYDFVVTMRQAKLLAIAKRTNNIVSSLFPSNVRNRIMKEAAEQAEMMEVVRNSKKKKNRYSSRNRLQRFADGGECDEFTQNKGIFGSVPIADLFPDATVLFADIVGFTAWSSVRDPTQVFQLLETLYGAFDEIAHKRKVFKIETIGDCYVAVTGLPEPRADHAVLMAKFANDITLKMSELCNKLELSLGPDTGDLCLRIGLNSGPVTAGVLRGEKARFQLFGGTVNFAADMESSGEREKIHISQTTANLLTEAGKAHWVIPREKKVIEKGGLEISTFWLVVQSFQASCQRVEAATSRGEQHQDSILCSNEEQDHNTMLWAQQSQSNLFEIDTTICPGSNQNSVLSDKIERLVSWNADVLLRLIKQIIARRNAQGRKFERPTLYQTQNLNRNVARSCLKIDKVDGQMVLDEVQEIIEMPRFDAKIEQRQEHDFNLIEISSDVELQLRDYITIIATMYQNNPFHNFEHASHVTMSVNKLLSRIVAPDVDEMAVVEEGTETCESTHRSYRLEHHIHDHTYGITSDPLTQFAVVFAALIHDVDHPGVPNAQLVKEGVDIAAMYKNKSIAEQNSVDLAWDLLMHDNFKDLLSALCSNQSELKHFRQVVVNTVMATDIVDKELKELRNNRWNKAFKKEEVAGDAATDKENINDMYGYGYGESHIDDVDRKATIVIEHLIQASDVAHTMQHWHIYRKWNERFYQELLRAYQTGRAEKDPTEFWYKGEIGFFDFYIIPLAKKLKECGVFGVSSDEYLNYAIANRNEWERKGEEVVAEMVRKYNNKSLFCYNEDQCKLGES